MNLKSIRPLTLCTLAALSLSSCGHAAFNEILFIHNLPHHVPFNEAEFTPSLRSGSGVVRGQLYEYFKNGTLYYASNTKVVLVPVTTYTTEIFQRKYANGAYLAKSDPRYMKYVRIAQTDDEGKFRFSNIPPGDYFVGSKIAYATTTEFTDADGLSSTEPETHYWRNYARISVKNGQIVSITDWSTGPERITNP